MGLRSLRHGEGQLTFTMPVDVEYSTHTGEGLIYAQGTPPPENRSGFELGPWVPVGGEGWKTHNSNCASVRKAEDKARKMEGNA
jgi:hypothetical protein